MKSNPTRMLATALSALALFATQPAARAAETPTEAPATAPSVTDAKLTGGMLRGQVVDSASAPRANETVTVSSGGEVLARVATDERGRFQAPLSRGGMVVVSSAGDERVVRTWTAQAAPPAAREGVLLVANDVAVRGQAGNWVSRNLLPIGLVGGAAAAIVIVSTDNDNDDRPSGS